MRKIPNYPVLKIYLCTGPSLYYPSSHESSQWFRLVASEFVFSWNNNFHENNSHRALGGLMNCFSFPASSSIFSYHVTLLKHLLSLTLEMKLCIWFLISCCPTTQLTFSSHSISDGISLCSRFVFSGSESTHKRIFNVWYRTTFWKMFCTSCGPYSNPSRKRLSQKKFIEGHLIVFLIPGQHK